MRIFSGLKMFFHKQEGYTLIELLIALAITGVVSTGVATAMYELKKVGDAHFTHMTAVNQVENALHYINRDVQSAQIVNPQGYTGFPLSLTWISWDTGDTNNVTYNLVSDAPLTTCNLTRQFQLNGDTPTTTSVARYIISHPYCNTSVSEASAIGSNVLKVTDTSAFPPVGALVLPGEHLPITYSGKTPTSFTGIPRSGSGSLTLSHSAGELVTTYSSYSSYYSADHRLVVQLTALVSRGSQQTEETRQINIVPRPGS
jgi:prepilin-type N-terminal cleavage/methylation domain-containing protein